MKQNYFASIIMVALFMSAINAGYTQESKAFSPTKTVQAVFVDVSPPIRDIIMFNKKKTIVDNKEIENKFDKRDKFINNAEEFTSDPVLQNYIKQSRDIGPTVEQVFPGGSNGDNLSVVGGMVAPPDTEGDVGPNYYVQMVNLVTTIFDKDGNVLMGPVANSVFWQGFVFEGKDFSNENDGDPVVLYDQFEDRWIVSHFAVDAEPYYELIAISKTPDPTGEYYRYAINYGADFPDYPKMGVWNDAIYISTRDFGPSSFLGSSLVGLPKAGLYDGTGSSGIKFTVPWGTYTHDGFLPADADGPVPPADGTPHYSMFKPYAASGSTLYIATTTPDWDNLPNSTMTIVPITVAPYLSPGSRVTQPNGITLDVLDWFLMYRLPYRNFGDHQSMMAIHSVKATSGGAYGIRWYEFRSPSPADAFTVYQQGTFLPADGENRWMGSIAMNGNGDIALGYSVTSSSTHPSIRFVGQSAGAPGGLGVMDLAETSIHAGSYSQGTSSLHRWGDYSMMTVDPTDDETFWFTTENASAVGGWGNWETKIAELKLNAAVSEPVTIEVTPASLAFDVLVDGTDDALLNIANTGLAGAPDLAWAISIGEVPPASSPGNNNFIHSFSAPIDYTGYAHAAIDHDATGSTISFNTVNVEYIAPAYLPILLSGNENGSGAEGEHSTLSPTTVTITHSSTQNIVQFNSVSCNSGSLHANNSYWRSFVLADFGITEDFDITDIEIGVEQALGNGGSQPLTVNLYTTDVSFPGGTLALIGTATYSVSDQALTVLSLPVSGLAPAGSELVVEIFTPDGQGAGNSFFIGSNPDGQTAASYLSAADCGVTDPTDVASLGFPDMHIVMNVTGNTDIVDVCSWLSAAPDSGTTSAGSSDDVTVSVDATGLAPGIYECQLTISSNASNTPEVVVPVTLNVTEVSTALTLPFFEGWETSNGTTTGDNAIYSGTGYDWAFTTTIQNKGKASWGTNAYLTHTGTGALTLDKDLPTNAYAVNSAIITMDMSNYTASTGLELSFWWTDHGDEEHPNDKVWIRGSNTDAWVVAYDINPMAYKNNQYNFSESLDIDELLASSGQTVSETFQMKFGQEDNGPIPNDGISFDDISVIEIVNNAATLPFVEDWESYSDINYFISPFVDEPTYSWSFETDLPGKGKVSYGTFAHQAYAGSGAMTMDKDFPTNAYAINATILTINLENYVASTDLELSFYWTDHGDEEHPNDKVWIRGNDSEEWVMAFDINPQLFANNQYRTSGPIDIDQLLASAMPSQTVSSTFQVKFGQEDNGPIPNDGLSFDDITIRENVPPPAQEGLIAGGIDGNQQSKVYELMNYPNPFRGTTTIQFILESTNNIKLKVYNSMGVEVANLYDGQAEGNRVYQIEFNSMDLPSGIYFYHLQTSDGVNTVKKMQLIK